MGTVDASVFTCDVCGKEELVKESNNWSPRTPKGWVHGRVWTERGKDQGFTACNECCKKKTLNQFRFGKKKPKKPKPEAQLQERPK
jgi:hypothetical protein